MNKEFMSTPSPLTIVIPAKNEAHNLPKLLESIVGQWWVVDFFISGTFPPDPFNRKEFPSHQVPVIIADANSTDGTQEVVDSFLSKNRMLDIKIIPGGMPAVGRNRGAALVTTPYILFLDADVTLWSSRLFSRAISVMEDGKQLVTTDIVCDGNWKDRMMYRGNNLFQRASQLIGPCFSTGMFMLWNREVFYQLGGFNESATFGEDYQLSRKVAPNKFKVVKGGVMTSGRRFERSGYWRTLKLFLKTAVQTAESDYYCRDHGYWD
jgi:glycosyltransferase involved in cell wall biosynthesis